ncbi:MAG: lipase family alpha/beta hydrolase [Stenotrophobium sp.]
MTEGAHVRAADVRGYSKLAVDAVLRTTDIVEGIHLNISRAPLALIKPLEGHTRGITGLVYSSIRTIASGVGVGLDLTLAAVVIAIEKNCAAAPSSAAREALVAAVNGVIGDHLEATSNPLALNMRFRRHGEALALDTDALHAAIPAASGKLLVQVHGLCMNDLQWSDAEGYNHGDMLAAKLSYTAVHLHYNSGRHISNNGREFAEQLEQLVQHWPVPVEELTLLGHSMGGLLARSACHYGAQASHGWLRPLKNIVFLGTPHHGAPMERSGNWLQVSVARIPFAAPLARLGMLRSAGVTDLRHSNLLDEDWQAYGRFERHDDTRQFVPLPQGVHCYAIAATTGKRPGDLNDKILGDGLVLVDSALGRHADPVRHLDFAPLNQALYYGMNHWDLLRRQDVGERILGWLRD